MELARPIYEEMLAHARGQAPLEACGILGGRQGQPVRFFPTPNGEQSPVRYAIPPADLFRVMRTLEGEGLDLLAIFHSHPATQAYPSATDVRLAFYPEACYLIMSLANPEEPVLRAFRIMDGQISEENLHIL